MAFPHGPAPHAALPSPRPASLTYEPYFGLREKPFGLAADPRFLFRSPTHAPAFDELAAGIRRREGLIVLTGEIGTGKTTLCRAVLSRLDRRTFSTFVPDPFVSREELLTMLLVDFGVMSVHDVKNGRLRGATRPELSYPLYEFLNSLVPLQAFAVLVIDEAQHLPPALLEEIRILSELERREKLLQVVLVGQPELRDKLKLPEMRQVAQRVSVRCGLEPLGREDVTRYVAHRLDVASDGTAVVQFTDAALDCVFAATGGVPRVINLLCDRALHEAWLGRTASIDAECVGRALAHLGMSDARGKAREPDVPLPAAASLIDSMNLPAPRADKAPTLAVAPAPDGRSRVPEIQTRDLAAEEALAAFAPEGPPPARRRLRRTLTGLVVASALLGGGAWYGTGPGVEATAVDVQLPPVPDSPRIRAAEGLPMLVPPGSLDVSPAGSAPRAFVIQVASFESDARAARLVEELTAAGYRATRRESRLEPPRGRLVQVLVGPYSSVSEAGDDLDRIRQIPGYVDAAMRTVAPGPPR